MSNSVDFVRYGKYEALPISGGNGDGVAITDDTVGQVNLYSEYDADNTDLDIPAGAFRYVLIWSSVELRFVQTANKVTPAVGTSYWILPKNTIIQRLVGYERDWLQYQRNEAASGKVRVGYQEPA